ncbi:hypothetical protein [Marinoscillum furvescens]|uniref:Uncharacterized protein n=1 Tax=Marinoscillum furvescens DSM 4134 TaxID=1122208 RepID=A0A3D9L4N9_MARFU|nr:hypothetical protein [Marinoscillum furvescens]RED98897.1 hypothetical protein C7460_10989 [Marinoscillum furvescens DSM 4134]
MKSLRVIFIFCLLLGSGAYLQTSAQLITDSDSKLKTSKQKDQKGGFFFNLFKGKNRSASGRQPQYQASSPRSASGSPFASFNKRKSVQPRTSNRQNLFKDYRSRGAMSSSGSIAALFKDRRSVAPRYSSGSPFTKKDKFVSPRYSAGDPFRQSFLARLFGTGQPAPRFSPGSPFSSKDMRVAPRLSGGKPFTKKDKMVSPRLSAGSPFQPTFWDKLFDRGPSPRYSAGMPFGKKDKMVSPRLSAGSPFTNKDIKVTPRLSSGSPFTKKDKTVSPRLSAGSPFTKKDKTVSPRLSAGSPFTKKDKNVAPRYSAGMPFSKKDKRVAPRLSPSSPYADQNWSWIKPRYSTNENRFEVNERLKKQTRTYNFFVSKYKGETKTYREWYKEAFNLAMTRGQGNFQATKLPRYDPLPNLDRMDYRGDFKQKWIRKNAMHPSVAHKKAKQDSELMRDGLRKWNIFWTRLNRNKEQPDAVTDKISKPKFDKKEADIWNE